MLSFRVLVTSFIFYLFSYTLHASNLVVVVKGKLSEEVRNNVHAHLGHLPESDLARSAFIYGAKENTLHALQALGYYQAKIVVDVSDKKPAVEQNSISTDSTNKSITDTNSTKNTKTDSQAPWRLNITITLNTPTLIDQVLITVEGEASEDISFQTLLNRHTLKHDQILHQGKYEALKSDLLSLGLQRGYFNAALVESNITIKNQLRYADITLHYKSGPRYQFGEVSFSDFDLDPILLSTLIPFQKKAYYSTEVFHELQYQLQSTQYFSSIIAVPGDKIQDEINHQYTVPINVSLTPAKSHQFDFGVGYATDTDLRISAGWRTPLINRHGHFQETKIEYSELNPTGKFIYSIPLTHPSNDLLQFKISVENEDYADLKTKYFSTQLGRLVNKNNWQRQIYTRYHQEAWEYALDEDAPNIDWTGLDTANYLIPGITWSRTIRAGSPLDPSEGFRQTYNIEGAHLAAGSDNTFFRIHGRWNYITTLAPKHRLVSRAEYGAIYVDREVELAPSLRFYAGGDQSIRGFAYQSIGSTIPSSSDPDQAVSIVVGGTRLMVASIEYQYYLTNKWRMALFSDGGSAADKGEFEPVYSFGSGLHYLSPVGAVKFYAAYGITDDEKNWRIHISLGAEL